MFLELDAVSREQNSQMDVGFGGLLLLVWVFEAIMDLTEIRVSSCLSDDVLTIIWEDNGVGIPAEDKERIFERGFGKNTGLGLFLVREVLSLTGIEITENGEPGKGARFEMAVPKGMWR